MLEETLSLDTSGIPTSFLINCTHSTEYDMFILPVHIYANDHIGVQSIGLLLQVHDLGHRLDDHVDVAEVLCERFLYTTENHTPTPIIAYSVYLK